MRYLSITVLAVVLGGAAVGAQGPRVVDLGGGIYQAIGIGLQGGAAVRVPQSNTDLVATTSRPCSGLASQAHGEIVALAGDAESKRTP